MNHLTLICLSRKDSENIRYFANHIQVSPILELCLHLRLKQWSCSWMNCKYLGIPDSRDPGLQCLLHHWSHSGPTGTTSHSKPCHRKLFPLLPPVFYSAGSQTQYLKQINLEKNERGRQEGRKKGKETKMKKREIRVARLISYELLNEIINVSFWGWENNSVLKQLPNMHKPLGLILSTTKDKYLG